MSLSYRQRRRLGLIRKTRPPTYAPPVRQSMDHSGLFRTARDAVRYREILRLLAVDGREDCQ